ncbi:MAG: zinc-binding alcohol dehydrogenase family protein [Pirellulales bacterium]|nr:zinc-binding alcohol dehydrogenase family protein [Pirellulales bacterium]
MTRLVSQPKRISIETTEAWILRRGEKGASEPGVLEKAAYPLPAMTEHHVLAEPIYGTWEANMTHCLERSPIDVCRIRREETVVLGNAGVVRILKTGSEVMTCREGDMCLVVPIGSEDEYGHMIKVFGYDAPNMMGMLARRAVFHELNVTPIPYPTRYSYVRWAGFPVRYGTAWENWKLCYNVWKAQFDLGDFPPPHLSGWGGAVSLAMAQLAVHFDCPASLVASTDYRLALLREEGITPIDRRKFPDLAFDDERFETDRAYRAKYLQSEGAFLAEIENVTHGKGVSIFVDNIGGPVFRAALRALGRLGIITTSGWKHGKHLAYDRTAATVNRHIFLHVHGCRRSEGLASVRFAEEHGWLPPDGAEVYAWNDIPRLAADYAAGKIQSYAPVFQVNPL